MAIEYKTEGRIVIAPVARMHDKPVALVWTTNANQVRLLQDANTVTLDQHQLRELKGLIETIWDDIGPDHHPTPE